MLLGGKNSSPIFPENSSKYILLLCLTAKSTFTITPIGKLHYVSPTHSSNIKSTQGEQLITAKPINCPTVGLSVGSFVFGRPISTAVISARSLCVYVCVMRVCMCVVRYHGDRPQSFCDPFRVDVVSGTEAAAVTTVTHHHPLILFWVYCSCCCCCCYCHNCCLQVAMSFR